MKAKHSKAPAERVVKDIRRATRKQYSAEEKIRIVLEGLRGEDSIAELCRREGIAQGVYYKWSKDFKSSRSSGWSRKAICLPSRRSTGWASPGLPSTAGMICTSGSAKRRWKIGVPARAGHGTGSRRRCRTIS